ncbi:MAG: LexA family transcriptional regulator [Cytophagales bacterium]|nr:LexA family transcriptional regulator [Cytophaga sp.]
MKPASNSIQQPIAEPTRLKGFKEDTCSVLDGFIQQSSATSCMVAKGASMVSDGIKEGDILIVDASLQPATNQLVVATVNGEISIKRISKYNDKLYLIPENQQFKPLEITPTMKVEVLGVVTYVIHKT